MCFAFAAMSELMINTIVSAIAIIAGAVVGGICSWIVTKKTIYRTERLQGKIEEDRRKFEENQKTKRICEETASIRLDMCTVMFQSLRILKGMEQETMLCPIPMNRNYSLSISALHGRLTIKEMSYLYQLYGIMEKVNTDINKLEHYSLDDKIEQIKQDYYLIIKKLYGINYDKAMEFQVDKIKYEELYDNEIIKSGYREVLKKLDSICEAKL